MFFLIIVLAFVLVYCRRVLGCHPILGCMEEELGGVQSHQSKIAMDRTVATTGIVVQGQLLTAFTIGPEREIS